MEYVDGLSLIANYNYTQRHKERIFNPVIVSPGTFIIDLLEGELIKNRHSLIKLLYSDLVINVFSKRW